MIRPQLQSTPLGKWTGQSHQRWIHFVNIKTMEKVSQSDINDAIIEADIETDNKEKFWDVKLTFWRSKFYSTLKLQWKR